MTPSKNDSSDLGVSGPRLQRFLPWVRTALTVACCVIALGAIYAVVGWTVTIGGVAITAPVTAMPVEPTSFDLGRHDVHGTVGSVELAITPDLVHYLLRAMATLPGAAIFLYALIMMRSLIATVPTGEAFTTANVTRICRIGLAFAVGWPIASMLSALATALMIRYENLGNEVVSTLNLWRFIWPLLAGVVLLVLAIALSVGTRMRDDVDGLV